MPIRFSDIQRFSVIGTLPSSLGQKSADNSVSMVAAPAQTRTPVAGVTSTIAVAATPVIVFGAGSIVNQALIINPISAAGQNLPNTESLFVDRTGAAPNLSGTGTTIELVPGQALRISTAQTTDVKAVAASAGHRFHASKE